MNPRLRKLLAIAALLLAAALALHQLRAHRPVEVTLRFDLNAMQLKVGGQDALASERLTSDKLESLRFALYRPGSSAPDAGGEFRLREPGRRPSVSSAPMELPPGEYALKVLAQFRRFDGSPHPARRVLPLAVTADGPIDVRLQDP